MMGRLNSGGRLPSRRGLAGWNNRARGGVLNTEPFLLSFPFIPLVRTTAAPILDRGAFLVRQHGDGPMTEENSRLRATFDEVALLYDRARPGYPGALFDDVVTLSGIPSGGRILEIGPGTGQATLPFARRGYRILGIELGANLAAVARHNLAAYPAVEVRTGAFEDWPVEAGAFDLAVAATAFHWLDSTIALQKIARALNSRGAIALFWNLHVQAGTTSFFEAAHEIYQREAPELAQGATPHFPGPGELTEPTKREIENTGLFGEVAVRGYQWDLIHDAASYLRVLDTYSGHRILDSVARERLFQGIAELIDTKFNGRITKSYQTILYVARRLERMPRPA